MLHDQTLFMTPKGQCVSLATKQTLQLMPQHYKHELNKNSKPPQKPKNSGSLVPAMHRQCCPAYSNFQVDCQPILWTLFYPFQIVEVYMRLTMNLSVLHSNPAYHQRTTLKHPTECDINSVAYRQVTLVANQHYGHVRVGMLPGVF